MLTFLTVILILLGIAIYLCELIMDIKGLGIMSIFLFFIAGILAAATELEDKPQAIDVYRGETTLQITYEDNIPIDTIVVFKNK